MKFHFDPNQEFQLAAIRSVVKLFEGQPAASQAGIEIRDDALCSLRLTDLGLANNCLLSDEQWLANANASQLANGLPGSPTLCRMTLVDGNPVSSFPSFTVEMETGTGKTYVYLRTIYELAMTYGFRKFIVVVPSVAIREGVLRTVSDTAEHFKQLYPGYPSQCVAYSASRWLELRHFALSEAIQILVMNIDAFAKDCSEQTGYARTGRGSRGNIINRPREGAPSPITFLRSTNPIVILDEPQNYDSDLRKLAIARLNPMCTIGYSATHRNAYNSVYALDAVSAYEQGLVKQISVDSVIDATDPNQAYIEVEAFKKTKKSVSVKVRIWQNRQGGARKQSLTIRVGDDLYGDTLSNRRHTYKTNFIVTEIDADRGLVRFANELIVRHGAPNGADNDDIIRLQIESTIRRHLEKAKVLQPRGIKVLSVFFIDRVANYRVYGDDGTVTNGQFAIWFEEIFSRLQRDEEFRGVCDDAPSAVHNGYFSHDKQAVSPFEEISSGGVSEAEATAFELIMRQKERLLKLSEPLAFIFSHSALREGWDNPNVFQICTFAESRSEVKKRQEIGRGLRLCVNSLTGDRVKDREVNRLTVIANESYEDFAAQLQGEMEEAGVRFTKDLIKNERAKTVVRLRSEYQRDASFRELWERIRQRTRYKVHFRTDTLITEAAARIREQLQALKRPQVLLTRAEVQISRGGVVATQTGEQTRQVEKDYVIPDLVSELQGKTGLTHSTIAALLLECGRLRDAIANPTLFVALVADIINEVKRSFLVDGVEYVKVEGLAYEMRQFEGDGLKEAFSADLYEVQSPDKTLFSHVRIDHQSTPELQFARSCDTNNDVLFYLKLPRWFTIDTPVGAYNPDWAVVYRNDSTIYFVAETKAAGADGRVHLELLAPIERLKIECGRKHFRQFAQVSFRVVSSVSDLLN